MSLRFKGSDLRPVLAEAVANQCRVVLAKDQGVYFLAEHGERRPDGRVGDQPAFPQQERFCWIGGHGTVPKEQNTQQSPALGRSNVWQVGHS